jgi:hypothetical protein
MLDLRRLRGPLAVAGGVLAAGWMMSALLWTAGVPSSPGLRPRESPLGWEYADLVGGKVAGVSVQLRRGQIPAGTRLGILMGRSTLREGIDPAILEQYGPRGFRWLSLYGSGGSLSYLADISDALNASDLRPAVVVLVISPYMLAGLPNLARPPARPGAVLGALAEGNLRAAAKALPRTLQATMWVLTQRRVLNQDYRRALHQARRQLFEFFNLEIDCLFPPDPQPWKVERRTFDFVMSERNLEPLGWFDSPSYAAEGPPVRTLVDIISDCRTRAAQIYIVLVPERSTFRKRMPTEARQLLSAVLAKHFGTDQPPVIDLRRALPDERFVDPFHPDGRGRRIESRQLADRLRAVVADGPRKGPGR